MAQRTLASRLADPAFLLRNVDGVPHVALGPIVLLAREPIADAVEVPVAQLVVFAVVFVAYGVIVLVGLRQAPLPRWLVLTAIAANAGFMVAVAASFIINSPSGLGMWIHALLLASAATVLSLLARAPRTSASPMH